MGSKIEVHSWEPDDNGKYEYKLVYSGDSFQDALRIMLYEKESGVGCVKLELR